MTSMQLTSSQAPVLGSQTSFLSVFSDSVLFETLMKCFFCGFLDEEGVDVRMLILTCCMMHRKLGSILKALMSALCQRFPLVGTPSDLQARYPSDLPIALMGLNSFNPIFQNVERLYLYGFKSVFILPRPAASALLDLPMGVIPEHDRALYMEHMIRNCLGSGILNDLTRIGMFSSVPNRMDALRFLSVVIENPAVYLTGIRQDFGDCVVRAKSLVRLLRSSFDFADISVIPHTIDTRNVLIGLPGAIGGFRLTIHFSHLEQVNRRSEEPHDLLPINQRLFYYYIYNQAHAQILN